MAFDEDWDLSVEELDRLEKDALMKIAERKSSSSSSSAAPAASSSSYPSPRHHHPFYLERPPSYSKIVALQTSPAKPKAKVHNIHSCFLVLFIFPDLIESWH